MTVTVKDLFGTWQLISWSLIYSDGRAPEFPLGPDALGMIMYTTDGHVTATLMRAGRSAIAPSTEAERATAYAESFAYAGRFDVRNDTVFHSIEIATNPSLIGLTSSRHISLDGDRLTLSGPDFTAEHARTQQIIWRRAS